MTTWRKIKNLKRKKQSKKGKRFLTQLDMAEGKHMEAVANSEFKLGIKPAQHKFIVVCGCGVEGCIFASYDLNLHGKIIPKQKLVLRKKATNKEIAEHLFPAYRKALNKANYAGFSNKFIIKYENGYVIIHKPGEGISKVRLYKFKDMIIALNNRIPN